MPRLNHEDPQIRQLRRMAQLTGAPLYGAFELTARCNLDCKMCYVHTMDAHEALRTELSTQEWLSIMDAACEQGMLFALLTGGECLLRPDFQELYLHLQERGVYVSVNTNATLINQAMADFFARNPPEYIQISLYGTSDEGYETVTGHRAYQRVVEAVDLLMERGIRPDIAVTVSKYLLPELESILTFIRQRKLSCKVLTRLVPPRGSTELPDYHLTLEQMLECLRIKRRVFGEKEPIPVENPPLPGCDCDTPTPGLTCIAGGIRFAVDHLGNMIPCLMLSELTCSLREHSFTEAWAQTRAEAARILRPGACSGCAYGKSCNKCLVYQVTDLHSGQCDPRQCQYTYERKKAGLIE